MTNRAFWRTALAAAAALSLTMAGCSNSETDSTAPKTSTAAQAPVSTASSQAGGANKTKTGTAGTITANTFSFEDAYVKAAPNGKAMTAIFGTFDNKSTTDAHIIGFTARLKAQHFELHEVVDGVMKEKKDGFIVPAGGTHTLKPGGDHLMIMGLKQAVEAGSTVTITLKFAGGTTLEIPDIPVRELAAGREDYGANGSAEMKGMKDMKGTRASSAPTKEMGDATDNGHSDSSK